MWHETIQFKYLGVKVVNGNPVSVECPYGAVIFVSWLVCAAVTRFVGTVLCNTWNSHFYIGIFAVVWNGHFLVLTPFVCKTLQMSFVSVPASTLRELRALRRDNARLHLQASQLQERVVSSERERDTLLSILVPELEQLAEQGAPEEVPAWETPRYTTDSESLFIQLQSVVSVLRKGKGKRLLPALEAQVTQNQQVRKRRKQAMQENYVPTNSSYPLYHAADSPQYH
jgi:hypothetical protein